MRTAVYIRVSTEDQAREGFSIAAQRDRLLAYIHSQNWVLTDMYVDEGVSAKDLNRPELGRLLADVAQKKMDVVLVYRLDRLTRSVLDLYQLLQEFEIYGVHFKSSTEVYDTTTAIGRLFITLVAALAQWERENLAERVKMGMGQMVRERKRPGGPAPYGYDLCNGQLQLRPKEADIVRHMFAHYVNGKSPRQIADEANAQGSRGKNGACWSSSAVLRLLKNPVYYGALRWNYTHTPPRTKQTNDYFLEPAVHPAIIDEATFVRAQERMKLRGSQHPRVLASSFLFSGILYCSICQAEMRGKYTHSQGKNGSAYTHTYYTCSGKSSGKCRAASIREDRLEQAVVRLLQSYRVQASAVLQECFGSSQQKKAMQIQSGLDTKWEERKKRWEDAYEAGVLSLTDLRVKLLELDQRQRQASLAQSLQTSTADEQNVEILLDWEKIWSHATREQRRQLATSLIQRMEAEACRDSPAGIKRFVYVSHVLFH
ncbi:recombinase family protein [Brevibacillus invocatus]|uniref:recombinase family protein n=1 Tax=Brevibacillus invocatus TaxID=173959 RepID=UPI0020402528|nr:recombinase family protein [Brevibacillus invocatus]MCM3081890.1 recombinase family protein [Brevibacillus invocatus]MCM3432296.1 recombinase family protein [Brevibacillus invocatus]